MFVTCILAPDQHDLVRPMNNTAKPYERSPLTSQARRKSGYNQQYAIINNNNAVLRLLHAPVKATLASASKSHATTVSCRYQNLPDMHPTHAPQMYIIYIICTYLPRLQSVQVSGGI